MFSYLNRISRYKDFVRFRTLQFSLMMKIKSIILFQKYITAFALILQSTTVERKDILKTFYNDFYDL